MEGARLKTKWMRNAKRKGRFATKLGTVNRSESPRLFFPSARTYHNQRSCVPGPGAAAIVFFLGLHTWLIRVVPPGVFVWSCSKARACAAARLTPGASRSAARARGSLHRMIFLIRLTSFHFYPWL